MAHFGGFWDHNFHKNGQIVLKYGPEVEHHKTKMAYEQSFKIMSLRGNRTYPKVTVLAHFGAQFTPGKSKIMPKNKIFPKNATLGL